MARLWSDVAVPLGSSGGPRLSWGSGGFSDWGICSQVQRVRPNSPGEGGAFPTAQGAEGEVRIWWDRSLWAVLLTLYPGLLPYYLASPVPCGGDDRFRRGHKLSLQKGAGYASQQPHW